jgi:antitoxin component YwqK of YwqJK toxin-antitoxin module
MKHYGLLFLGIIVFSCSNNKKNANVDFEYITSCPECTLDTIKNSNGKLEMVISEKNGVKHGVVKSWWPNGKLSAENYYKDGVMHGPQKMWDENGTVIGNSVWNDGKICK